MGIRYFIERHTATQTNKKTDRETATQTDRLRETERDRERLCWWLTGKSVEAGNSRPVSPNLVKIRSGSFSFFSHMHLRVYVCVFLCVLFCACVCVSCFLC